MPKPKPFNGRLTAATRRAISLPVNTTAKQAMNHFRNLTALLSIETGLNCPPGHGEAFARLDPRR